MVNGHAMFVFNFWIPKSDGCVSCFEKKNYMKSSEMLSKSQISRFPGAGHPLPLEKAKKNVQKRGLRLNSRSERPRTPHRRSPRCVKPPGRCKAIAPRKMPEKIRGLYRNNRAIFVPGTLVDLNVGRVEILGKKSFLNVRFWSFKGQLPG